MNTFKRLWPIIRGLCTALGLVTLFLAVSTSDYYVMELGEEEPAHMFWMLAIGAVLLVPAVVHLIRDHIDY